MAKFTYRRTKGTRNGGSTDISIDVDLAPVLRILVILLTVLI